MRGPWLMGLHAIIVSQESLMAKPRGIQTSPTRLVVLLDIPSQENTMGRPEHVTFPPSQKPAFSGEAGDGPQKGRAGGKVGDTAAVLRKYGGGFRGGRKEERLAGKSPGFGPGRKKPVHRKVLPFFRTFMHFLAQKMQV